MIKKETPINQPIEACRNGSDMYFFGSIFLIVQKLIPQPVPLRYETLYNELSLDIVRIHHTILSVDLISCTKCNKLLQSWPKLLDTEMKYWNVLHLSSNN